MATNNNNNNNNNSNINSNSSSDSVNLKCNEPETRHHFYTSYDQPACPPTLAHPPALLPSPIHPRAHTLPWRHAFRMIASGPTALPISFAPCARATVRARLRRSSAMIVFHSKPISCGAFE